MKNVWIVSLFLFCSTASAREVRVCEHADGSLEVIYWATEKRETPGHLQGLNCVDMDNSDLPANRNRRDAWRLANGEVKPDPNVKTKKELFLERRQAKRAKMKQKLKLTDEDLADLKAALE